jgi:CTP:molybdopterin cytidylyltransferase MocA
MSAALILAAGSGSRFGDDPKLLADLEGRPVLEHVLHHARSVRCFTRIVVVLGAHADEIRSRVDLGGVEVVECPAWASGQAASLRCGLEALSGALKVVVLLGDQPLVTPQVVEWLANEPAGSRAVYDGRPGHPVVLGPRLMHKALTLEGDRGLRDLVKWHPVEVGHLASDRDVDTLEDLEALRDEARAVL